ncbi:MAG: phosphoribosylglycinamide synthetase C domain-containing protein, partial [Bacteroidales bacterium]|nr:phosphoribosylglycinamide synthetase C domain-containing protein [Bacteroidales bacterium]
AVSPVPFADSDFIKLTEKSIVIPTIEGLKSEGIDYKGFIFIGLMNCGGTPYVIEYNVRMGDPETEAVMPRIKSDLLSHFIAVGNETLDQERIVISKEYALTLVMVSGGYPGSFVKGYRIEGTERVDEGTLFHAGTALKDGELITSGGRVLALTLLSDGIEHGRELLYSQAGRVSFKDMFYRKDIGLDLL